jgi:hypothetical protein
VPSLTRLLSRPWAWHLVPVEGRTGGEDRHVQETEFALTQRRANVHQNVALPISAFAQRAKRHAADTTRCAAM